MNTIPADHPLRASSWIWPEFYMYLQNHFAQFRWDVQLAEVRPQVPLFITADKSYRLYVNGQPVCRGPARGYQSHWPVDEVDIAAFLTPGHNRNSVEAYQPGCSTFQYLHQNYAGLLMATSDPLLRDALAHTKVAMRRSPGHQKETARYSLQIDFQEHLDLRLDDRTWITSATAPVGWRAEYFPAKAQQFLKIPFGRTPYDSVEPRQIPLLREGFHVPALPTVQAAGESHPSYAETGNVSWHWIGEGREIKQWQSADSLVAQRSDRELTFTVPATGTGRFHAVVVPVGAYLLGCVEVSVENAGGGEILDFQHDQYFRDGQFHYVEPGDGCAVAMGNRLILRQGSNFHSFYHPMGFGALTVIARDLSVPLTLKLRVRTVGYPFAMRGEFACSDATLNAIHAACRNTQQLCSMDAYVDTPWREQAQWWGDARVQARNTFYLDGDARLLARGIRSLAGQSVQGLTPGHAPTSSYWCVLPDFALTWILTIWDHYWQTGSLELYREQTARIREVLAYFDRPEARHASGLLQHDPRFWLFEDWSTLPKDGLPTFLNLWYILTLRHLEKLAAADGNAAESGRWQQLHQRHTQLVLAHCWDSGKNVFHPALKPDLTPYGEPAVHDQTLALMLGLQPQAHAGFMERFVRPYLRGETLAGAVPSAFWATYVLEEAIARGHGREAVAFIQKNWAPMLATGTTWEDFKWEESSGGSACHAWTSHPSFHLVNALAGVQQRAAGWTKIALQPCFLEGLSEARARIPAPPGDIEAAWQRTASGIRVSLTVPAGVDVETDLPLTETAPRGDGRRRLEAIVK